jgi:hypothetical protein
MNKDTLQCITKINFLFISCSAKLSSSFYEIVVVVCFTYFYERLYFLILLTNNFFAIYAIIGLDFLIGLLTGITHYQRW